MTAPNLKSQLALVTGATGGIGQATCYALAALGVNVAVHYNSAVDAATQLASTLQTQYAIEADMFQADLSQYEPARKLHNQVVEKMGHPSILFNNAGLTLGKTNLESVHDVTIEEFEQTWRTNCGTSFLLTQLCISEMEKQQFGRVVFCSSAAAFTGVVGPHYASSKSALHGLIHWLSQRYCSKGITVNGVAPALIQGTSMLPGDRASAELKSKIPTGRLGWPEEVAETVVWMIKCGYVTNKVIGVDGGHYAQG